MQHFYNRRLKINLPNKKSAFLLGPRNVGKSTYLKKKFPDSVYIDLLNTQNFIKYSNEPWLLAEELMAIEQNDKKKLQKPIIIDEIQKVPLLLNEVHRLIEDKSLQFILCGSSARKLRKGGVNLLGGRAWNLEMHPLVFPEINNFNLLKVLNRGKIPSHLLSEHYDKDIADYISLYLKEEVLEEGLTRNLRAFSKFLEVASFSNSELLNYNNVARDVGVDAKTVKKHYQILVDTLIGHFVMPYIPKMSRSDVFLSPKFYFFDTGIAQSLNGVKLTNTRGEVFGHYFEQFILTEIKAHSSYSNKNYEVKYWRTRGGAEVDFVLGRGELALEVKGTNKVSNKSLLGIYELNKKANIKQTIVVSNEAVERLHDNILIMPYQIFLQKLWNNELI